MATVQVLFKQLPMLFISELLSENRRPCSLGRMIE